jgi:hypothetical protein
MLYQHKRYDINFIKRHIERVSGHIDEYRRHILDRIHQNILKNIMNVSEAYRGVSELSKYSDTPAGVSSAYRTRITPAAVSNTYLIWNT